MVRRCAMVSSGPIAKAAEIIAERWTPLVVSEMLA